MKTSKQIEIFEITLEDDVKGIQITKESPISIGYSEGDIIRILQMILLPNEEPIRKEEMLSDEELVSLLHKAASIGEEKLRNERLGMTLLELVRSGGTRFRLEIFPDSPTVEMLRVDITTEEIKQDTKDGFISEWYMWDVVRKIELEDRTRVIVHVP